MIGEEREMARKRTRERKSKSKRERTSERWGEKEISREKD